VFAISAGNEGPGHETVGSPGSAARALSAGASTVPHFVGAPLTVGAATYGVAAGDFKTVTADLTAPLGVVLAGTGLNNACSALPAGSLTGKIGVVSRGGCTFSKKIRSAQDAGAVAAIVVNNVAGDPTAMGLGGIANEPTIPAYMAALGNRAALMAANGESATIDATNAYFATANADIMAGFSSQGPTDVDFRVKPDVVAPGVNVLSSIPQSYCDQGTDCFAFFQGTSMAAPHLAGAAAIVRQAHPLWPAWAVRSAIVNTADQGRLLDSTTGTKVVTDVNVTGSGIVNLESAVKASAVLSPVSVSFGATPAGSGATKGVAVTVLNASDAPVTWSVAIADASGAGVTFSTSVASVQLAAGASTTFTVNAVFSKSAPKGDNQAWLRIGDVAHAAVYALVK
jgi:subtilisin family serine protease